MEREISAFDRIESKEVADISKLLVEQAQDVVNQFGNIIKSPYVPGEENIGKEFIDSHKEGVDSLIEAGRKFYNMDYSIVDTADNESKEEFYSMLIRTSIECYAIILLTAKIREAKSRIEVEEWRTAVQYMCQSFKEDLEKFFQNKLVSATRDEYLKLTMSALFVEQSMRSVL